MLGGFGSITLLQKFTPHFKILDPRLKNVDIKTYQCHYAYQRYGHLLISIKEILRSGEFDDDLLKKLQHADDYILDNTPIVDKQARMYDKLFH